MKERYQNMMAQISLNEEARGRIADELAQGGRARRKVSSRPILAAACVCLALVGGAFAANGLYGVQVGRQQSSVEESSYRVQAEFGCWEIETMGEQLREDLKADSLQRSFADRESLEDYLGVFLIHSAALEESGIVEDLEVSIKYGWDVRPELTADPNVRYVLTGTTVDGEEMNGTPEVLKVTSHRVMENAEVFIDARIVTDRADPETVSGGLAGETFAPRKEIWVEFVRDEDGKILEDENGPLTKIDYYTTAEKEFTAEEYEMANGLTATIITAADVLLDGSTSFREYFGYFISDGILYTVYPYAIYDPSLSFPMLDSDMLIVLETVLDSFE